jgi:hypothetical protein
MVDILKDIKSIYEERKQYYKREFDNKKAAVSMIGYLRLLAFIVGVSITVYTYMMKAYYASIVLFVVSAGIFIYLIRKHQRALRDKRYSEMMMNINDEAVKRVSGQWKQFKDNGEEFLDEGHNYSGDLDIFGKSSLFQWLSMCSTFNGRIKLADLLRTPLMNIEQIKKRQEAVKELSEGLQWRQEFSGEGRLISEKSNNPERLLKWAEDKNDLYRQMWFIYLFNIIPATTVLFVLMVFIIPGFSYRIALGAIALNIIILMVRNAERTWVLESIYKFKDNIMIYLKLVESIEEREFNSEYLKNLKSTLMGRDGKSTGEALRKLQGISDLISDRRNFFYIIIDILFLWDYQCMFKLEKWRELYGVKLKDWLNTIGEFEALNSIAGIAFDNKDWVMPEVKEEGTVLRTKAMGHPLLGEGRVANDVGIEPPTSILLITGSNMSGKSTLLRTIGINLVLSYIGATVCAQQFTCSIMQVYTCMRIGDNLEKSISSFYAEIIRIKMIVEAAKRDEKVFFLLDEIFKGTNSIDRHMGAKYLIKQLGDCGASGLVSTHDLELGELEKEFKKIRNYHFQEHYEKGELKFDYKLRKGVSTTRNAMYLIKMAGIDIDNSK